MKKIIRRILDASIGTKFIGFSASLLGLLILAAVLAISEMQKNASVAEATHFADGMEQVALAGLTTMMVTNQMQNRNLLLEQINESGIVKDLRIMRSDKVIKVFGEGKLFERPKYDYERLVLTQGQPYSSLEQNDNLRIVKPIVARANYLGKNCLGCHQARDGEILGAISMQISLTQVMNQSREFSLKMAATGVASIMLLVVGLLVLSHVMLQKPLERIVKIFARLEAKDYTGKFTPEYNDEIGQLGESFISFQEHAIELFTKLSKVSRQLSDLADKTRHSSEVFLELASGQAAAIEETSASVSELSQSLQLEKAELSLYLRAVSEMTESLRQWQLHYQSSGLQNNNLQKTLGDSIRNFKNGFKQLLTTLQSTDAIFRSITSDPPNMQKISPEDVQRLHDLALGLSQHKIYFKQGLIQLGKFQKDFLEKWENLTVAGEMLTRAGKEVSEMKKIHAQIEREFESQTEAGKEIRNTLNILSTESAQVSAGAEELTQMAHEASRLAVLIRDLMQEFKLP